MTEKAFEDYKERAYLVGRYLEDYRAAGTFDPVVEGLIREGMDLDKADGTDRARTFLTHMISRDKVYEEEDGARCPILIYKADPICYGILNAFADALARELDKRGILVEICDLAEEGEDALLGYRGKRFRAIIGFQTYAFSIRMADKVTNLHDLIKGPKFNVIFDHPVWMRNHLLKGPKESYVITHDPNYARFIRRCFPGVKETFVIPPGGEEWEEDKRGGKAAGASKEGSWEEDRPLPLTFVGSYHDWQAWVPDFEKADEATDGTASEVLLEARTHLHATWEEDLRQVLKQQGRKLSNEDFRDLLFQVKPVCFIVMTELRERIIKSILDKGLPLHVYGDSWKAPVWKDYPNLHIHPDLSPGESLKVFSSSRLSLNIMSWHKGGMTERIANIQRNGAVCISDESDYLTGHYTNGTDIVTFDLEHFDELPDRIQYLLDDPEEAEAIGEAGKEKADQAETWERRGNQILDVISRVNPVGRA